MDLYFDLEMMNKNEFIVGDEIEISLTTNIELKHMVISFFNEQQEKAAFEDKDEGAKFTSIRLEDGKRRYTLTGKIPETCPFGHFIFHRITYIGTTIGLGLIWSNKDPDYDHYSDAVYGLEYTPEFDVIKNL